MSRACLPSDRLALHLVGAVAQNPERDGVIRAHWGCADIAAVDRMKEAASGLTGAVRCSSQAMVKKEVAVCLLAYNLVHWAMAKAAALTDELPRGLSFTGAKRLLIAFADQL